jgi:hypothetical protein
MASSNLSGFGSPSSSDDPLGQAVELLKRPQQFSKTYDSSPQRYEGLHEPVIKAVRLLIGEVESLRDEVKELRGQLDAK